MLRNLLFTFSFVTLAAASRAAPQQSASERKVAIVVWPGVELLDFAGPGEVFGATRGFEVFTVATRAEPVVSQGFLSVNPTYSIEDAPAPDILVLPGGGATPASRDEALLRWIKECAPETEVILTVCTGAKVLAATGLLDGLEATTYRGVIDHLRDFAPQTVVHRGRRWVDNGRVVTATGVSAGIDAALHVLARLRGTERAVATADYMHYRWAPEEHRWAQQGLEGSGHDETSTALAAARKEAENSEESSPAAFSAACTAIEFHRLRGRTEHATKLAGDLVITTEPSMDTWPMLHALSLRLLGRCLLEVNDLETAEEVLLESLELCRAAHDEQHPAAQACLSLLARLYEESENDEALERARRSLWSRRQSRP